MPAKTMRRRLLLVACAGALLPGCAPRYDWREVRDALDCVALLPARPTRETRALTLFGDTVNFTLISADVGDDHFAFGSTELTDRLASASMRSQVVDRFQSALLAQTRSTLDRDGDAPVRAWTLARATPPAIARQVEAHAEGRRLVARFYVDGRRLLEQVAWFDPKRLSAADLATFLDGLQPG